MSKANPSQAGGQSDKNIDLANAEQATDQNLEISPPSAATGTGNIKPTKFTPANILKLQRTVGNQTVQRLLRQHNQPKPTTIQRQLVFDESWGYTLLGVTAKYTRLQQDLNKDFEALKVRYQFLANLNLDNPPDDFIALATFIADYDNAKPVTWANYETFKEILAGFQNQALELKRIMLLAKIAAANNEIQELRENETAYGKVVKKLNSFLGTWQILTPETETVFTQAAMELYNEAQTHVDSLKRQIESKEQHERNKAQEETLRLLKQQRDAEEAEEKRIAQERKLEEQALQAKLEKEQEIQKQAEQERLAKVQAEEIKIRKEIEARLQAQKEQEAREREAREQVLQQQIEQEQREREQEQIIMAFDQLTAFDQQVHETGQLDEAAALLDEGNTPDLQDAFIHTQAAYQALMGIVATGEGQTLENIAAAQAELQTLVGLARTIIERTPRELPNNVKINKAVDWLKENHGEAKAFAPQCKAAAAAVFYDGDWKNIQKAYNQENLTEEERQMRARHEDTLRSPDYRYRYAKNKTAFISDLLRENEIGPDEITKVHRTSHDAAPDYSIKVKLRGMTQYVLHAHIDGVTHEVAAGNNPVHIKKTGGTKVEGGFGDKVHPADYNAILPNVGQIQAAFINSGL